VEPDPDRIVVNEGDVVVTETDGKFAEVVSTQHHEMIADEPARYGGANTSPTPYEYLLGALGVLYDHNNTNVRYPKEATGAPHLGTLKSREDTCARLRATRNNRRENG